MDTLEKFTNTERFYKFSIDIVSETAAIAFSHHVLKKDYTDLTRAPTDHHPSALLLDRVGECHVPVVWNTMLVQVIPCKLLGSTHHLLEVRERPLPHRALRLHNWSMQGKSPTQSAKQGYTDCENTVQNMTTQCWQ